MTLSSTQSQGAGKTKKPPFRFLGAFAGIPFSLFHLQLAIPP
jgi:hypothetical protein